MAFQWSADFRGYRHQLSRHKRHFFRCRGLLGAGHERLRERDQLECHTHRELSSGHYHAPGQPGGIAGLERGLSSDGHWDDSAWVSMALERHPRAWWNECHADDQRRAVQ